MAARTWEIVVETPKGSHNKLKFDPERNAFRLSHVLPLGMSFPFDFGYVPETRADDGDPLDVLILMDAPVQKLAGCLVDVRLIGVLEVEQREKDSSCAGHPTRSDAWWASPPDAPLSEGFDTPRRCRANPASTRLKRRGAGPQYLGWFDLTDFEYHRTLVASPRQETSAQRSVRVSFT